MKKSFYITTTLPYVNADPHVGFAMEIIRADAVARFKMKEGYDVYFNTGTDEHGQKLFIGAKDAGKDVKQYVDEFALRFQELPKTLGVSSEIHFVRTTDSHHEKAAQEFWKRCRDNGFIYKKSYKIKYCVGCELEKTDSELVDGRCPIHPNRDIELIDEENYFFKFSAFQEKLSAYYAENPDFVIPDFRFNEIKSFVERGLDDFSISRLKEKMSWGVPVPEDDSQVMYVWFDALVNYISTLGWPEDEGTFRKYWQDGETVQYCGKDNLRQQSAMWQAMLMSVGLPNTRHIVINGFITGDGGVKMSKSIGNVVNPYDVVAEYGTDALRFFLLKEISNFEDSPFTLERFKDAYNAGLANGLGNLVSRIMKMAESNEVTLDNYQRKQDKEASIKECMSKFDIKSAMDSIWSDVTTLDGYIQSEQPFKLIKTDPEAGKASMLYLLGELRSIAENLSPFLPETSEKILGLIESGKSPEMPLFLRKE